MVEISLRYFVLCYFRDKSACTTYIIKEVSEENEEGCKAPSRGRIQEWIPILLVEGDDFEIRNNQVTKNHSGKIKHFRSWLCSGVTLVRGERFTKVV